VPGIVVADTGPLRYLVLIGHDDVLPRLFGAVSVPTTVADELRHPRSPDAVRAWMAKPPPWLAVHPDPAVPAPDLQRLDRGERAAIALAHALGAGLLLIDDRAGVVAARGRGFRVTGTIGVLIEAASQGLLDLAAAFAALRITNFRHAPGLLDTVLAAWRQERGA
jgi:predicted nucleic acid-binding protein